MRLAQGIEHTALFPGLPERGFISRPTHEIATESAIASRVMGKQEIQRLVEIRVVMNFAGQD